MIPAAVDISSTIGLTSQIPDMFTTVLQAGQILQQTGRAPELHEQTGEGKEGSEHFWPEGEESRQQAKVVEGSQNLHNCRRVQTGGFRRSGRYQERSESEEKVVNSKEEAVNFKEEVVAPEQIPATLVMDAEPLPRKVQENKKWFQKKRNPLEYSAMYKKVLWKTKLSSKNFKYMQTLSAILHLYFSVLILTNFNQSKCSILLVSPLFW